jgi:adenylate cyclase
MSVVNISQRIIKVKRVAWNLLDKLDESLIYHRKEHTTNCVFPSAIKIAELETFSQQDMLLVAISAAFHDTGYLKKYVANESEGAKMAENYMKKNFTNQQIVTVMKTIQNTDMKNPPATKFEKVLRDADLCSLGYNDFINWSNDLQEESKLHPESFLHQFSLNNADWSRSQLKFLINHEWFTESAKKLYQKNKELNIVLLKKSIA